MASDIHSPSLVLDEEQVGNRPAGEEPWPHHGLLILFTLIWGANFVLAEVALAEMTPIAFSVARFAMGGAGLLLILRLPARWRGMDGGNGRARLRIGRRDWPRLLLVSVMGATLAPWLGIEGLAQTYAGRAALWLALAPPFSALVGTLIRTERIGRRGRIGLLLAAAGSVGMAADSFLPGRAFWFGDVLLLAAMTLAVCELHLIRPLAWRYGAARVVALRTTIGGLFYLAIASPAMTTQPWLALSVWVWVAIVAGGFVGVGVGQWVKVRALRAIGPTQVVIYGNMVPLATLVIASLTIGGQSSLLEVLAGLLIVTGAVFTQLGATPLGSPRQVSMPVAASASVGRDEDQT